MKTEGEVLLSVAEVAERLRVSPQTVYRRIADGVIPALRLGPGPNDTLRVDRAELERWIYDNKQNG